MIVAFPSPSSAENAKHLCGVALVKMADHRLLVTFTPETTGSYMLRQGERAYMVSLNGRSGEGAMSLEAGDSFSSMGPAHVSCGGTAISRDGVLGLKLQWSFSGPLPSASEHSEEFIPASR